MKQSGLLPNALERLSNMTMQRKHAGETDKEYLLRVLAFCKAEYNRRRTIEHCHCSHTASDIMRKAEQLFPDTGTFGCEGFCDGIGEHGVSYLNTGDCYGLTIIFQSSHNSGRWSIGCWGDIVESPTGIKRFGGDR